jgi:hypothetical protein
MRISAILARGCSPPHGHSVTPASMLSINESVFMPLFVAWREPDVSQNGINNLENGVRCFMTEQGAGFERNSKRQSDNL